MKNLILFVTIATVGLVSCKKHDPQLGDPPTAADAEFTYQASATNDNIIEFTASNSEMRALWDFGNGATAEGTNVTGVFPMAGTYTVTLTVFNKGGSASSTQEIVIAQTDPTLLDDPVFNALTGGINGPGSKIWVIDSLASAHMGVGPDPVGGAGDYPEWWAANPLDKSGVGMYDDQYEFTLIDFKFDMITNGEAYVHNELAGDFPGSYENLNDYTAPFPDQLDENWVVTEDADGTYLSVTGNSFLGMYTGVQTYKIIEISDTSLFLQYKHHSGGLHWYLKLIPEGFVSSGGGGGGGGGGGTTVLPIDFETETPVFEVFGNTVYDIIPNPQSGGNNTSATVLEVTHGNETWSGLFTDLATPLDFTTQTTIQLKVWAPVAGDFRFKVENSANTNDFVEIDATVTTPNTWETISVDFSGSASGVYDRLVIFPGWNVISSDVFYIDDIEQL